MSSKGLPNENVNALARCIGLWVIATGLNFCDLKDVAQLLDKLGHKLRAPVGKQGGGGTITTYDFTVQNLGNFVRILCLERESLTPL